MTELKSIQLIKAAKELNIGLHTAVQHLAGNGHVVEDKPNTKLTPEQYEILLKAFKKDSEVKKQAENIVIGPHHAKKETAPEPKPAVSEFVRQTVKLEGPKVVDKIDIDKKKVEKKPVVEAPVKPKVEEVPAPVSVQVKEEPTAQVAVPEPVPIPSAVPEPQVAPEPVPLQEPVPEPIAVEVATDEVPPMVASPEDVAASPDDNVHKTQYGTLAGLNVKGKIILPDPRPSKPVEKPTEKEKRKRIKKPVDINRVGSDQGGAGSTDRSTFHDRPQGSGTRRPGGGPPYQGPRKPADAAAKPEGTTGLSAKEIEERKKQLLNRMGGGNKTSSTNQKDTNRKGRGKSEQEAETDVVKKIKVTEFIPVSELASLMNVTPTQIISACFSLGVFVSINQRLPADVIETVALEFGYEVEFINVTDTEKLEEEEDKPEDLLPRPPIVTIMGHVDHGKTSLLDYIRSTNIVAGEAGGITQHIGAYEVTLPESGKQITFLDTPGHEAFTAMRARGAQLTDIVVIVVAADDNVMPQTKEAISHALAANVPMVIAINKIDKPDANPDNIRQQLSNMNILVEEWGGKYQCQEISAKKGTGVNELLEKILLEAEMLELKANPNRNASGSVIEASLDKGRGYVSTVMVQKGTLKVGDMIVAGQYYGKVKAMTNERGIKVLKAGPSTPVQVLGLNGAPAAGDTFKVYSNEQEAKEIANKRATILREQGIRAQKHITLDEIGRRLKLGNFKEIKIIVKGDVDGSVEALSDALLRLSTEEIQISIVLRGVGAITENDVNLAAASDAIIVAFQVRPTPQARAAAERESIEIRYYSIIYDAIEDVKKAMEGMLAPKFEEKIVGNVEVRETFKISKVGTIAGCYVLDGKISRNSNIRIIRDGIVVHTGELDSLKRFKDDVKEVLKGFECGIKIKNFNDIQVGDIIEAFEQVEVKRKLA
jgi:translation initiation factor IF-2